MPYRTKTVKQRYNITDEEEQEIINRVVSLARGTFEASIVAQITEKIKGALQYACSKYDDGRAFINGDSLHINFGVDMGYGIIWSVLGETRRLKAEAEDARREKVEKAKARKRQREQ